MHDPARAHWLGVIDGTSFSRRQEDLKRRPDTQFTVNIDPATRLFDDAVDHG